MFSVLFQRIPKMLTRINDQHMVHLASGGEFNLALDSDLCLWVWGKNDSGQVRQKCVQCQVFSLYLV